jgi:hypothetical protein
MLRDGRWVQPTSATGVLGIGAAAFLLSYDALHSLAVASGVRPGLARIWPGVLDGFIVVATLTVVAAKRARQPTWYPWALVALFSAASVAFNILHALDRYLSAARWVGPLVFAMPPSPWCWRPTCCCSRAPGGANTPRPRPARRRRFRQTTEYRNRKRTAPPRPTPPRSTLMRRPGNAPCCSSRRPRRPGGS